MQIYIDKDYSEPNRYYDIYYIVDLNTKTVLEEMRDVTENYIADAIAKWEKQCPNLELMRAMRYRLVEEK